MNDHRSLKHSVPVKLLLELISIIFCAVSTSVILLGISTQVVYAQEPSVFETTIDAISWHPDNSMIALGLEDGTCVIIDAQSQQTEFSAAVGTWPVYAVAWNSTGELFAAGSYNGTLKAWNIVEQQLLHTWNIVGKSGLIAVTWTPQGDHVISGFSDGITTLSVWDVATGELLAESSPGSIDGFVWSPNGSKLTVTNFIGYVLIVDGETFRTEAEYEVGNETSRVTTAAWSPDGQFIAAGSVDGTVRIWNFDTQALVHLFDANEGDVNSRTADTGLTPDSNILHIAFSSNGNQLGSVSTDGTIRIWDTVTGQVVLDESLVEGDQRISAAAWNPDGNQLAYGVRSSLDIRETYLEIIPVSLDQAH